MAVFVPGTDQAFDPAFLSRLCRKLRRRRVNRAGNAWVVRERELLQRSPEHERR